MKYPMIAFNKIHPTTVGADLSALTAFSALPIISSMCIIAPDGVEWLMPQAEHQIRHQHP